MIINQDVNAPTYDVLIWILFKFVNDQFKQFKQTMGIIMATYVLIY